MSQQDFQILKCKLMNALTLVGGGRANADALTAYAALYIAKLDAFYRDQKRIPTSLEAKAPVGAGAGLKEDARRGVESALLRLASRAFGGAGRTNLTRELEPYEAARRTLGLAKDETRKTLDYLVSLERRGPHALAPQQQPQPAQTQTPMRKGSKRATPTTPRRSPLRDVNANTSPVKKKSKKKAAPRSSGVTLQDQNAMAMRMSSTKRVDWTIRLTNDENEEKPRVVTGKPAGKPKNKVVKVTLKDESERASASASVASARASTPAPVATSTLKNKVKVEAKDNTSVSSSATPAAVAVAARTTSFATSTLKNKVKVEAKDNTSVSSSATPAAVAVAARATSFATSKLKNKVKIEAKENTSLSYFASPAAVARATTTLNHASSSIATTSKADKIRVKSEKST